MKMKSQHLAWLSTLAGITLFAVAIWVLFREIRAVTLAEISAQFALLQWSTLVFASALCVVSYALLTCYDFAAMRMTGIALPYRTVAPIAFSAFAIGHNVGVASLSGGAIRYRAYSLAGLTNPQIGTIIAFIPLTFFLGSALLLGTSLVLEPSRVLAALPLSPFWLRLLGYGLLLVCLFYLFGVAIIRRPIRIGPWDVQLPSARMGAFQFLLASTDIVLTSLVLYVLVQSATPVHYFAFLAAFLLAMVAGALSNVPGGIGVFESAMILLLPQVPVSILLGAILAYRILYYLLPLGVAVALIAIHEMYEHSARLQQVTIKGLAWGTRLIPQALGAAVFVAGAYLLVRGSIPLHLGPVGLVNNVVPLPLLEMSHLLSSAIGAALIVVARGLYRRLSRAWLATMALLASGIIASIIQFNSLAQVFLLGFVLVLAFLSRAEFFRGKRLLDQRYGAQWITNIVIVLLAVIGIGLIANRSVDYSHELWWQFTLNGEASRMLRASLLAAILVGGFGLARLLRGSPAESKEVSAQEFAQVKQIVATSRFSVANIALLGDKRFLFHPSGEAFIMYQACGGSFIALSDPIGNELRFEELLWQFREACDAQNMRCVFYEISDKYLSLYIDLGLSFLKLGEEGTVALNEFSLEGPQRAQFRQALNKAKRDGAEFSIVPADQVAQIMDELERVSLSWLKGKSADEKGFSLGFFDRNYLANFDCAVVKVAGEIVAFANLWPSAQRHELSVDLMRYTEHAPKAIMDFLFTEMMLWGKSQGYTRFSLGMAPLSGLEHHYLATRWHKIGNLVYHFGENFYNFEGLRHYKNKFDPAWQSRFLACKGGLQTPAALLDTTILISGGFKEILSK